MVLLVKKRYKAIEDVHVALIVYNRACRESRLHGRRIFVQNRKELFKIELRSLRRQIVERRGQNVSKQ